MVMLLQLLWPVTHAGRLVMTAFSAAGSNDKNEKRGGKAGLFKDRAADSPLGAKPRMISAVCQGNPRVGIGTPL
jgi:hypothetical protein